GGAVVLEGAAVIAEVVVLPELVQRLLEIGDELGGEEGLAAATALALRLEAVGALVVGGDGLVERDADGGGPFDDVEELAEGQRDEPDDDDDLVDEGDEPVIVAVPEHDGGGQREARHGDGEEQDERHEVEAEAL